jgi:hypothetical protein
MLHLARPMNVECIIGDCVRHSPHADLNSDIATYLNSLPSSLSLSPASTHQRDCRVARASRSRDGMGAVFCGNVKPSDLPQHTIGYRKRADVHWSVSGRLP